MTYFRDFSTPIWEVFFGNLLMLSTIGFYMTWWALSFRPRGSGETSFSRLFVIAALLTGLTAITLLLIGINSLSQAGKGFPFIYILLGSGASYIVLLGITKIVFQRTVTSELLLIVIWTALELSVIIALQNGGRFNISQTLVLGMLVMLATVIGLVCYILHYRLNEITAFWNGLVPLVVDAATLIVSLSILAFS